jgi:hypothetical protein
MALLSTQPFTEWPRTPAAHFRLHLLAAVSRLLRQVVETFGTHEETYERFPFLQGYRDLLATLEPNGLNDDLLDGWWQGSLRQWEATVESNLPIQALRDGSNGNGLDSEVITLLITAGLVEEDLRFGQLFESMQDGPMSRRPSVGLLQAWWCDETGYGTVRGHIRRLRELGLIQLVNAETSGLETSVQVNPILWEALRGETAERPSPWLSWRKAESLPDLDDLVIADSLRDRVVKLLATLEKGEAQALILRGPQRNGRRTLLGAIARATGRGMLEIGGFQHQGHQANDQRWLPDDSRWQIAGVLATLLHAIPVIVSEIPPGENLELPCWRGYDGLTGVVLGKQGGVIGASVERAITLQLDMPDPTARLRHWEAGLGTSRAENLGLIGERFRMTSGNIRRAARLAAVNAALSGHNDVTVADVQQASRILNRQTLETLATPLPVSGDWNSLAVSSESVEELLLLETRCRHRERLRQSLGGDFGAHLTAGVRALFTGPSGTGKTLAAKLLASSLQMDLYRLDLSAVVNKYIGETEKNLNQIFARAEELDVILLLDEGDALLTQRTEVSNANDRYANLETNYLLQRLESFDGILIVTTNAGDRIDTAFQRRMDVVISFPTPDVTERWRIWQLHLPISHKIPFDLLDEVALRCELTGGQIRNAALHTSLLALSSGELITAAHLESALSREYRKVGSICPLRFNVQQVESCDRW